MQNIVRNFASDLLRHRRYNYSQQPLQQFLLINPEIEYLNPRIPNRDSHLLDTLLLKQSHNSTCILYAHGLGSNKLEVLSIAKYFLRQGFDVCSFDFSGSGRSEGDYLTYGVNEKHDVLTVLRYLEGMKVSQGSQAEREKYNRIVLWGRSMGAVAVVLSQEEEEHSKVDCLILDSPFSSFEKVAVEIASKKSFVPQFMLEVVMEPLKDYFRTQPTPANPFTIDLHTTLKHISTKMLLIYSLTDTVVSCQHSKAIIKSCRQNPVQIIIKQDHNSQRSKSTLSKALNFIKDCTREQERRALLSRSKNRGISVTSKDGRERESVRSSSKIRLTTVGSGERLMTGRMGVGKGKGNHSDRYMRTVASIHEQMECSKRLETQSSPVRRKGGRICSVFMENRILEQRLSNCGNKENKPSLNMLRRNRFH